MDTPAAVAASPRSGFVTTLAWISIVLAGFATATTLLQAMVVWTMMPAGPLLHSEALPVPPVLVFVSAHLRWIVAVMLAVSALTLVSAIGLLQRREWARVLFIVMLAVGIAWSLGVLGLQVSMVSTVMTPLPDTPLEAHDHFVRMAHLSFGFALLLALGLSALLGWLIVRLGSDRVRAEFRATSVR